MQKFPNAPIDRLRSLRVRDVMSSSVVSVPSHATMCEAAQVLVDSGASGAPVVDETGRCIGVISARDFLKREAESCQRRASSVGVACGASADDQQQCVRDYMSPAVQTVDADASLASAARIMCAQEIHRLIAVDQHASPTGVLSTLDVTSALVAAIDEDRQNLGRKENVR